jgi:acetylornithine aminotransferase/acetylornithine/N-succinyldiaminopimelate aminotransferase
MTQETTATIHSELAPASKATALPAVDVAQVQADVANYMLNTYKRPAIVFTHGKGVYLYDSTGRKYLDFLGGIAVNALGYSHRRLVRVIQREAGRAIHVSNLFHNSYQGALAKKLVQWSGMGRVFFTNSGAEAIEGALKLARAAAQQKAGSGPKKTRILALENSFHGRTFGALSITYPEKYRAPFAPLLEGVEFVRFNDLDDLEAKFDDTVCAVVLETVQGEGGIFPVSEAFWQRARQLAEQNGAALIADEIQSGLGRTGLAFAYQRFSGGASGAEWLPDIVTIAKPLAGGIPLGAILVREKFAQVLSPGMHGTTFGGGPLACAAALEFLNVIEDEKLLENVRERGTQLREGLQKLARKFKFIREVRGEGLMIGVDLTCDGTAYVEECLKQGLIINCTHGHILRLLPPFNVNAAQVKQFLRIFGKVLKETPRPKVEPVAASVPDATAGTMAQAAPR